VQQVGDVSSEDHLRGMTGRPCHIHHTRPPPAASSLAGPRSREDNPATRPPGRRGRRKEPHLKRGPLHAGIGASILIWGFVFIPLKRLTNGDYTSHPLSPEGFLLLRFVPLVPLFAILFLRRLRVEKSGLLRRDWAYVAAMGLCMIPGYHLPLNFALATPIHTGLMSLILNMTPALTYILALMFRQERPRRERTIGVIVAFAGLSLICGEEIFLDLRGGSGVAFSWKGAGLLLIASFSWSSFNLIARRLSRDHGGRFTFAAAGIAGAFWLLAFAPFLSCARRIEEYMALEPIDWAAWAYASLLAAFVAYWFWILALRHFEASRLASIGNLVPLLVHAFSAIFLPAERKALTLVYLLGAAITLLGTTLVIRWPAGSGSTAGRP
jgi:drug/metabolite transporter (DMT)-like permease